MRGYFNDEDPELEKPRRDRELTLGWGALSALFLGLVLICGLCFGLGYGMGRHSSAPEPAAAAQPPAAPDAEPLQANGSIPKPDAAAQAPVPPPAQSSDNQQVPPGPGSGATPAPAQASPGASGQGGAPANAPASPAPTPVRPALGASGADPSQASPTQTVHAALPSMSQYMVEIAAVRNAEDANVLTNALRRRDYPVTERREPLDGLIHVRIGPFPSHEEANRWRDKLQGDGYNAMIQP